MHTEIKMAFTDTAEKGSHYEAPYTLHFPEKYDVTESYDPDNLHHAAASIVKTADNMTAQALNGFYHCLWWCCSYHRRHMGKRPV